MNQTDKTWEEAYLTRMKQGAKFIIIRVAIIVREELDEGYE